MTLEPIWRSHYEDGVSAEVDTTDHLLTDDLTETVNRYPGHTALHLVLKYLPLGLTLQSKVTYRELDLASNRVAHALRSLGLKQGERVAIMLPNTPQYVIALYGILKAGLVVVNTNPIYTAPELEHIFSDSNAKAVICMSGGLETVRSIQANTEIEHILITDINETLPGLARKLSSRQLTALGHMAEVVYGGGVYNLHLLMSQQTARSLAPVGDPDSMAVLQYTGGTTGQPRAAVLTHRSLGTNTSQTRAWFAKAVQHRAVAAAEAQEGATAGKLVNRGYGGGGHRRVPSERITDRRPEHHPLGGSGHDAEGDVQLAGQRLGISDSNVVEAHFLGQSRSAGNIREVVGEHGDAEFHGWAASALGVNGTVILYRAEFSKRILL